MQKFPTKKSAYIVDAFGRPTLCLVGQNNTLLFHVVLDGANENRTILKTVFWFHNAGKCIQDISFDPSGSMVLILCKFSFRLVVAFGRKECDTFILAILYGGK